MAITIDKLRRQVRTIPVDFGDEKIAITYRVSAITTREALDAQKYQREIQRKSDEGTITDEENEAATGWMINQVIKLVEAWDIVTDEKSGDMFPITEENLWDLDAALLNRIIIAIGEDKRPNSTTVSS